MNPEGNNSMAIYNDFCKNLKEGYILYNVDSTNSWGDYFLVVNVAKVCINKIMTYTALLLGLRKDKDKFVPRDSRIKLTPDCATNVPFLKYIGKCSYRLIPEIKDVEVNIGLAAVYGSTDIHKFASSLHLHKPRNRKYGNDGKPVVKKAGND
jgi:hypothetical protein